MHIALGAERSILTGPNADLYDGLIGSWDVEVDDFLADGTVRRQVGEWHFGYVLEGRAIADVFVVPRRGQRADAPLSAGNRYGATVRVYDPRAGVWHVVWFNPVTGAINQLIGRREGDRILQRGRDGHKDIRWTFSDLTAASFHWRGESSLDGGASWRLDVAFEAGRRVPAA